MSNLIITMIAIALAVVVATMGGMYVNPGIFKSKEYKHQVESGFLRLKVAYDLHISYKGVRPSVPVDALDETWKTQLNGLGERLQVPKAIQGGFDWSYNKPAGSNRYYFCLSGTYNKPALRGFNNALDDMKNSYVNINTTCGATTDDDTITSGSVAITYWLAS